MPEPTLESMISNTDYFEIDSEQVGTRFGIWVHRPPGYAEDVERSYETLYVTDGNMSAALLAPILPLSQDPIWPLRPVLQVAVGYVGDEARDASRLRNRDLVPPGEPVAPEMVSAIAGYVKQGLFTQEQADDYLASVRDTHADRFLAFFEEELHPQIAARYRVTPGRCGLFGYSYGGLFSLYALLRRSPLFGVYGVGSPGISTDESVVYSMLSKCAQDSVDFGDVQVHVTMGELEIVGPSEVYRTIGRHFVSFVEQLYQAQLKGLTLSVRIIPEQTHSTGPAPSHLSFLRACYPTS